MVTKNRIGVAVSIAVEIGSIDNMVVVVSNPPHTQMDKKNGILALFKCKMAFFKRAWPIIKVASRP